MVKVESKDKATPFIAGTESQWVFIRTAGLPLDQMAIYIKTGRMSEMKRYGFYVFFIITLISFFTLNTLADVPMLINYQGHLTDGTGISLDGNHNIKFSLYNSETSSVPLWTDQQTVTVNEGVFNVQLGSGTASPLTPEIFDNPVLYLEIEIFINSTLSETLAPRQKITSSEFAIKAGDSDIEASLLLARLFL